MTGNSYREKDIQRHDQTTNGDKSGWCGDWSKSDRLSSFVWAALFIWAGAVLLASNAGWLENLGAQSNDSHWVIFFLGAGSISLIEVLIKLTAPSVHKPELISYLFIILAFGIASGTLRYIWPLFLIVIGATIIWDIHSEGNRSPGGGQGH